MASGTVIPFHLRASEAAFFTRRSCWLDMLGELFDYSVAIIIDTIDVNVNVTPSIGLISLDIVIKLDWAFAAEWIDNNRRE